MVLQALDWWIIGIFFIILLAIGWVASQSASKNTSEYFLGGRSMPWWLLGISMVATTFSADTPNLVAGLVREGGVANNWAWWAFLITGMVTVFIYAKLWRRSEVVTDLGLYELRYGGKAASFLRGFRALYLGIFFNCLIMGTVTLAGIKIGSIMLGLEPWVIVLSISVIVVLYSSLGGIKGVIWADFFQFGIAMTGAFYAAYIVLQEPEIGGLHALITHPDVVPKLNLIPDLSDPSLLLTLFIIPIAVQWWAVWYPGSEPGGGGYIAQRMLAAKDEENAIGASLLFNVAHYALRPWPWIIVALASIVIYPDLASIKSEFPNIKEQYLGDDIAYPAMLTKLGTGWLGLVVASLIAAIMSTLSTHLNWGASYLVNDFYKRFIRPDSSEEHLVAMGRWATAGLMILSAIMAMTILENATQAFDILLLSGAGSGAIYLLRWFWWRINAWTEIVAMASATIMAFVLVLLVPDAWVETTLLDAAAVKLLIAVSFTSLVWIATTYLTKPESMETLIRFYQQVQPGGPGWKKVIDAAEKQDILFSEEQKGWDLPQSLLSVALGTLGIYAALFSTGNFIYGKWAWGLGLMFISLTSSFLVIRLWRQLKIN
ncbi:Na+:solute symporter [Bacteroidota bacterium]|jgi:Na+/proline symporter|nr:Na+:solute symporter [Balneolaceae bacterium]MDC3136392.1 Na+:solute symporter [Bacteroidota bacterium]MDC3296802.1 Na+:solute symporter [Balneolaceae bacterium]PDH55736.1 MAG: Na+:solute symporter [Rhodothermaeota bacterium MED-G12]CAI8342368.1 MAG: Sodium/glucose cotransporter [Rhodothermaeota bacterium MED-G12]|tara:strand:- start:5908 stop:7710 length:1803 start_codon:yes stop_codon:yes gene_type:complete